jgi:hypothetical protein
VLVERKKKPTNKERKTNMKNNLTNTEKTWRVGEDCYGIELLNLTQRHEVHNLKTYGYTLYNVTPTGNALLSVRSASGHTDVCVFPNGKLDFTHTHYNRD